MNFSTIIPFIQNISSTSFNFVVILAAIIISVFYIWLLNREKILSILFATYLSYALIYIFPYALWANHLDVNKLVLFKLFLFIISFIVFSLIFILTKTMAGDRGGFFVFRWLKSILFALAQLGLFVSLIMTLIPVEWLVKISSSIQDLFISPLARFIWFTAPLIILLITKRPRRKGPGRPSLD